MGRELPELMHKDEAGFAVDSNVLTAMMAGGDYGTKDFTACAAARLAQQARGYLKLVPVRLSVSELFKNWVGVVVREALGLIVVAVVIARPEPRNVSVVPAG